MSADTLATTPRPASRADRRHRLTIAQYHRMIDAGIFTKRDRPVLWKGQLVQKMTKHPPHVTAQVKLCGQMFRLISDGWHVRQDQPAELSDDSVPEPDLTVVRGTPDDYARRQPTARDVALVVEVADTSLAEDQGEVLETYAAEAIPVYWLVNLPHRRIEVYTDPTGPADRPAYRDHRSYGPEDTVPVVLDGREVGRIAVRDVLP